MGAESIRFWSLSEVKPASTAFPPSRSTSHAGLFVFADWSLDAHGYAVRLTGDQDSVYIVGGNEPTLVARTFASFLQCYLDESPRLWGLDACQGCGGPLDRKPKVTFYPLGFVIGLATVALVAPFFYWFVGPLLGSLSWPLAVAFLAGFSIKWQRRWRCSTCEGRAAHCVNS